MGNFNSKILVMQGGACRSLVTGLGYLSEFEKARYRPFNTFIGSSIAAYVLAIYLSGHIYHKTPGIISRVGEYSNRSTWNYLKAFGAIRFKVGTFDPLFDIDRIVDESFRDGLIEYKALKKLKAKFYLTLMEYETGDPIVADVGVFARENSEKDTRDLFKAALGYPAVCNRLSFEVKGKKYLDGGIAMPIPYYPKRLNETLGLLIDQRTKDKVFDYFTESIARAAYGTGPVYQQIMAVDHLRNLDFDMLTRMSDHGLTSVISGGKDIETPFIGSDTKTMFSDYSLSRRKAQDYLRQF